MARADVVRAAERVIDEERLEEVLRAAGARKQNASARAALREVLQAEAAELALEAVAYAREVGRDADANCVACAAARRARAR